jgi:hypothetical protein
VAWTYDVTQLNGTGANNLLFQVRFQMGDTDSTLQQKNATLQDEEIQYLLASYGNNVILAAVHGAENLLSRWARKEVGTTSHQDSARYQNLKDTLARLRRQLAFGAAWAASGQSIAGKAAVESQPDRVSPAFERDQIDYPGTQGTSGAGTATNQTAP